MRFRRAGRIVASGCGWVFCGLVVCGMAISLFASKAASQEAPVWPPNEWECPTGTVLRRSQDDSSRIQACVHLDGSPHGLMGIWDGSGRAIRMLEYRANQEHGRVQEWFDNGRRSLDGVFSRGEPNGLWTRWHRDGSIESRVHFSDGVLEGPATWWHASGARRLEGRHRRGKQIGLWTSWRVDGSQRNECQWVDGKRITPCKTWPPS